MAWLSCIASNVVLASLLAAVAWLVQRRFNRPGVARVLWLLVLVKLVTPPLVSLPVGQASGRMACALGYCNCGQHATAQFIVRDTLPWVLLAVWGAGAAAMSWIVARRWLQFQHLMRRARPAPRRWQAQAVRLAAELRLRRPPEILAVPGRISPLVIAGFGRSRMLVPGELLDRLSRAQRQALLVHELTHIRRGDHLVRIVELVVGVLFWWLPITGAIGRQLRACEEACCDRAVLARLPQARCDYAQLLLDVIDFADPLPRHAPQVTAMSAGADLEARLLAILDTSARSRRVWPAGLLAMGLALVILPCGLRYDFYAAPQAGSTDDGAAAMFLCPERHFATVQLEEAACASQR